MCVTSQLTSLSLQVITMFAYYVMPITEVLYLISECYCRKESREVSCTKENLASPFYCCENICGHPLDCGNHFCEEQCHQGDCKPCDLKPDVVKCCPCGKTLLSDIKIEVSLSSLALVILLGFNS